MVDMSQPYPVQHREGLNLRRTPQAARPLRTRLVLAAAGLIVLSFQAEAQPAGDATAEQATGLDNQTLQEVVVTGSIIPRTNFQTPSPVQVITATDLAQSGYTSVQQALNALSANGQGTLSQAFTGGFAKIRVEICVFVRIVRDNKVRHYGNVVVSITEECGPAFRRRIQVKAQHGQRDELDGGYRDTNLSVSGAAVEHAHMDSPESIVNK